jgi:hypothetical protein
MKVIKDGTLYKKPPIEFVVSISELLRISLNHKERTVKLNIGDNYTISLYYAYEELIFVDEEIYLAGLDREVKHYFIDLGGEESE